MKTATIYREGNPITGALVMFINDQDGENFTARGLADKPAYLAEAKRIGAAVIPSA